MLSKELLEILCCPATKQVLHEADNAELEKVNSKLAAEEKLEAALLSADKKRAYPIRQGIPVLLTENAISIE
jgi:uncharacterized protein YbaR (Trm112 family)